MSCEGWPAVIAMVTVFVWVGVGVTGGILQAGGKSSTKIACSVGPRESVVESLGDGRAFPRDKLDIFQLISDPW